jgi:hypothetical protein
MVSKLRIISGGGMQNATRSCSNRRQARIALAPGKNITIAIDDLNTFSLLAAITEAMGQDAAITEAPAYPKAAGELARATADKHLAR